MLKVVEIPISLYIHTPWCVRKCPYCDFNSHAVRGKIPEQEYLAVLIRDWESKKKDLFGRNIHSIFIGGGTPSLLSPEFYSQLFSEIKKDVDFSPEMEITLEANPGTVEQERFLGFRQTGINRISLGIQSFHPEKLKILGRIHNGDEAQMAIMAAQKAGFENINLDLMHGLPQQNCEEALDDLKIACSFNTPHLSWYQLTLEPNTIFHKFPPALPDEEILSDIQENGRRFLSAQGFEHYEVSAYAKNGFYSQHNLNYWEFGDYIGIGAGAHGKITDEKNQIIRRYSNLKHPTMYMDSQKILQENKNVLASELAFEFMMNALRLNKPIPIDLFARRTGLKLSSLEKKIEKARKQNLLKITENFIETTALGKQFLNNILEIFL